MAVAMLYTRCPECQTTFRITEEILQKADGQVRCGRCAHIFNARGFLRDEQSGASARSEVAADDETDSRTESADADEQAERGTTGTTDATGPDENASGPTEEPPETSGGSDRLRAQERAAVAASGPGDKAPDSKVSKDAAQRKDAEAAGAESEDAEPKDAESDDAESDDTESKDAAPDDAESDDTESKDAAPEPSERGSNSILPGMSETRLPGWWSELTDVHSSRRVWTIGAAVLGAILLLQFAHHYRAGLARVPLMGSAVVAFYGMFGSDVTRRYDLAQYAIVESAAVAQPDAGEHGWLLIEARLRNRGPRAQPYPHIFLTLEDRWQKNIAGRYFAPNEYLISPVSDISEMAVGATVDAQLIIVDPGPEASGFEIDVCIQFDDGFACAADAQLD
jgi:predicted Zn finger-like uncharacterized protein